jgi:tetratricopeptide (TPR) repeat protein
MVAQLSGTRAELGWAYGQIGATERGLELARQADMFAEIKIPILRAWTRAILARLHLLRGEIDAAEAALAGLAGFYEVQRAWSYITPYWVDVGLAQAELALAQGDYDRTIGLADELYGEVIRLDVRPYRADLQWLKGRALLALGRLDEAHIALSQAHADAEAIGSRRMLWPVLAALGELAKRRGQPAEAAALCAQAWTVVATLADHGPPELREAFLHMPQVQSLRPER